jgi:hypothetical protein
VRRRWVPRLGDESLWRRFRRRVRQAVGWTKELAPDGLELLGESLAVGIAILVIGVLLVVVGLPVLFALLDLAVVLLLALTGVAARVVFRRPWVIELADDDGQVRTWRVVGWRASSRKLDEIEQVLRIGLPLPADDA